MSTNNKKRRNVVLILCDQLRSDFLNAYGTDYFPTPNISALADNGVVFENAITASTVCAPARASIVTGEHVSCHGGWTNGIPCKPGTVYLPERLNDAGYMTAAVGIFDHAPKGNTIGYQYLALFNDGYKEGKAVEGYMSYLKNKYPDETTHWAKDPEDPLHFKYPEEDYYDRWSTDRATDFIESYVKTGKAPNGAEASEEGAPFFLYCGFNCPHGPYIAPKEMKGRIDPSKLPPMVNSTREDVGVVEKYRRAFLNPHEALVNPDSPEVIAKRQQLRVVYAEMISEVDDLVGRIVKSLKDNGVYENTTIIFSSDHGSVENDYNVVTKGPWPYRSQLFIPLIVSNQPGLEVGAHSDTLCGNLDIGATVLDIAGDNKKFGVSRSLIGLADGSLPERRVNMSEFCDSSRTLVDKRYTYMYYNFAQDAVLYDRIADPLEMNNLAGKPEYAEVERRFLMDMVDYAAISKTPRMEAHDVTPEVRAGLEEKDPNFLDEFVICYPLASMDEVERVREAGLDADYNEFCRTRKVTAHYGAYFLPKE